MSSEGDLDGQSLHTVVLEPDIAKGVYGDYYFMTLLEIFYPSKAKGAAYVFDFELNVIRSHAVLPAGKLPTEASADYKVKANEFVLPMLKMFQRMNFY